MSADLSGITDVNYYPRGIAAVLKCAFYASKNGVEYVSADNASKGVLAQLPAAEYPVLGVAARIFQPGQPSFVYFVVRANSTTTGGIYRVPMPNACL